MRRTTGDNGDEDVNASVGGGDGNQYAADEIFGVLRTTWLELKLSKEH
jgi:hypothetical protein